MTEKLKIVFIGNSIVAGFPHKRSQCFVSLLREATKQDIINKGQNGDTTQGILDRFEQDVLSKNPDMVFILTGTNDFIYKEASPEECLGNLDKLARLSKGNGIEPILCSPPPIDPKMAKEKWMAGADVDYPSVKIRLTKFSDALISYCQSNQLKFLDLHAAYDRYIETSEEPAFVDGLHPTIEGHRFIFQVIKKHFFV